MSKYTTELRFICETLAGETESAGYTDTNSIIETARPLIFNFDYPIFDNNYKSVLETKIIKHFYTREIGAETYGLFHLWLDTKMNEIMPYYNKLYESQLLEFNPFYEVDYTKTGETDRKDTGTKTDKFDGEKTITASGTKTTNIDEEYGIDVTTQDNGTEVGTITDEKTRNLTSATTDTGTENDVPKNERWDYYSDTPQGEVNGLRNNTYLTNARHIVDDASGSSKTHNTTSNTTDGGTEKNERTINDTTSNYRAQTGTNTRTGTNTEQTSSTTSDVTDNTGTETRNLRTLGEYTEHVVGKMSGVSYSKLLKDFRETFLNIDMLVIRELNDLFMNLW